MRLNKCGLVFIVAAGFLIILYAFGGGGQSSEDNHGGYYSGFMNSIGKEGLPFPFGRNHGKVSLKALLIAAIDVAQRGGLEVIAVRKGAAQLEENIKGFALINIDVIIANVIIFKVKSYLIFRQNQGRSQRQCNPRRL